MVDDVVLAEFRGLLERDQSLLGRTYRAIESGMTNEQIREQEGNETVHFVYNYRAIIAALLEGIIPDSPAKASLIASRFRSILKNRQRDLSPGAISILRQRLSQLEAVAENLTQREAEDLELAETTQAAEDAAVVGVYVYALPHYIRHPYDPDTGRTLLKVGFSDRDIIERFRNARSTSLPEDPVLLRVYACEPGDARALERRFHDLLDAAGHDRAASRGGGTEYFLTSTRFLDTLARTLGIEPTVHGLETDYFD